MKHQTHSDTHTVAEKNIPLLNALSECIAACNYCLASCLREEDVKPMVTCIQLDRDCAVICQVAFTYVAEQSEFAPDILKLCADVCARCSAECRLHPMEHCVECEEACLKCEQACRDHLEML